MLTRQIRGDKIFLLVKISYSGFGSFFHNYLYTKKREVSKILTSFVQKGILAGTEITEIFKIKFHLCPLSFHHKCKLSILLC